MSLYIRITLHLNFQLPVHHATSLYSCLTYLQSWWLALPFHCVTDFSFSLKSKDILMGSCLNYLPLNLHQITSTSQILSLVVLLFIPAAAKELLFLYLFFIPSFSPWLSVLLLTRSSEKNKRFNSGNMFECISKNKASFKHSWLTIYYSAFFSQIVYYIFQTVKTSLVPECCHFYSTGQVNDRGTWILLF